MKFIVKKEEGKEGIIKLSLQEDEGRVNLRGTDINGHTKILMVFEDGRFRKIAMAGLQGVYTDSVGRIKEYILKEHEE